MSSQETKTNYGYIDVDHSGEVICVECYNKFARFRESQLVGLPNLKKASKLSCAVCERNLRIAYESYNSGGPSE